MKQLKKPTRKIKKLLQEKKLNPNNWLVERQHANVVFLYHKESKKLKKMKVEGL